MTDLGLWRRIHAMVLVFGAHRVDKEGMAITQVEENLEDLLHTLGCEQSMLLRCEAAGIRPNALRGLRDGTRHAVEFHAIHLLARLLGMEPARVDRAITVRRRIAVPQF